MPLLPRFRAIFVSLRSAAPDKTELAFERGYRPGWVAHKYHEKFGDWPQHGGITPIKPSPEVLSWVRSRNIAWAKSNQRAAQ